MLDVLLFLRRQLRNRNHTYFVFCYNVNMIIKSLCWKICLRCSEKSSISNESFRKYNIRSNTKSISVAAANSNSQQCNNKCKNQTFMILKDIHCTHTYTSLSSVLHKRDHSIPALLYCISFIMVNSRGFMCLQTHKRRLRMQQPSACLPSSQTVNT